jgi:hypothetical protein
MTPLGPGEMRARRRPLVVLSIAGVRLLLALCLALPLASLVAESAVGQSSRGDRALFEGGGYLLLELLRVQGANLAAAARGLVPLLLLGLLVTAACNAALLVALNVQGRLRIVPWLSQAIATVPALVVLAVGTALAQLAIILIGLLLADGIPGSMTRPVAMTAAQVALWLLVGLAAGAVGGIADVTKAALVRNDAGLAAALKHAVASARRWPLTAGWGWLPYGLLFVLAWFAAAQVVSAVDVSAAGSWRVAIVFIVHQVVSLAGVALRAAWYARALRLAAAA